MLVLVVDDSAFARSRIAHILTRAGHTVVEAENGKQALELGRFAVAYAPGYNWTNTPRQVQIVVRGNTFTAYIDGKQVLQGTDSTYTQGGVGFRTWDGTTARFGNISVDPLK